MWTNETIFSAGDLNGEEYEVFIEQEYEGSYQERLEHVEYMLERLQAEKNMLEDTN